jgi:ADP-heptose:LPS heptosyltransferase
MSNVKKALVVRYGAFGDALNITPVLKKLKQEGYEVTANVNKRTEEVLRHNPNIDKFIMHDESIPIDSLSEHWDKLKKETEHDKFINFSESIECNVALHPINPEYIYPKYERFERCNKNYYEVSEKWAGLEGCQTIPEFFPTEEEKEKALKLVKPEMFNILWSLSGSGKQKVYPWAEYVMGQILKDYEDVNIITIGDMRSQLLETLIDERIVNLSGEISMRDSMTLTKYVNLVIAPDTGVLHASGCYETPKIGLLGHTNKENITKHFINDFSLEAECACSPCFHLIYDHDVQCPVDVVTRAAWCMAYGIAPERLCDQIKKVYELSKKGEFQNVCYNC